MKQVLSQTIVSGGNRCVFNDYALEFNGTDEYLTRALPTDIVANLFVPSTSTGGNAPTNWSKVGTSGNTTISYSTSEAGSAGCLKLVFNSTTQNGIYSSFNLTSGKKYKFTIRYKSTSDILIGAFTINASAYEGLKATSQWNTVVRTFTANTNGSVPIWLWSNVSGATLLIESISITEDWKLDLNESYELIKHSMNRDFEQTLGAELNSGTVTIGKKYIVTAGTVEGNTVGTEFLAVTTATTLDASNKVREIPNLVTNGTFTGGGTGFASEEPAKITFADNVVHYIASTTGYGIYTSGATNEILRTGRRYRLSFQILNYIAGGLRTGGAGVPTSSTFASDGVHTFDFTYTGTNGKIYILGVGTTTLDLDNIHIYEISDYASAGNHSFTYSLIDKYAGTGSLLISASGAGRGAELSTNSGASGLTDWTNPTSGIAQGWSVASATGSIVTGNGFTGNAQRVVCADTSTGYIYLTTGILTKDKTYEISGKFRSNKTMDIRPWSGTAYAQISANTSNAIDFKVTFTHAYSESRFYFGITVGHVAGDWFEIDEISIKEVLGEVSLPSAQIDTLVSGNKYTKEIYARLDASSLSYGSDLFSSINNSATSPYETLTVSGNDIVSAVNTTANGDAFINIGAVTIGEIFKVTFNFTLNSGTRPIVTIRQTASTISGTNAPTLTPTDGVNTLYLNIINFNSNPNYLCFTNIGNITDFSATDIVITKATPITLTASLGGKSVTSSPLSIVSGTFTKTVLNFEASASEVGQDLKMYLSGAGNVWVDSVSLTQAYDVAIVLSKKSLSHANSDWVIATGYGSIDYNGYDLTIQPTGAINLSLRGSPTLAEFTTIAGNTNLTWFDIIGIIDRVSVNGTTNRSNTLSQLTSKSLTQYGKIILTRQLVIGSWVVGGTDSFQGLLAPLQIIRFTNISQSNFDPTTYKIGQSVTGGGAEVVLWFDPKLGLNATLMLQDYSGKGNSLTAVNLSTENRVNVKDTVNRLLENTTSGSTYQYLTDSDGQYIGVSY